MKKCPKDIVNRLKCWWDSQEERCGESHVYCRDCPLHVPGYSMEDAVKDVIAYVYSLEAAQPKWISVEEGLPEDDLPENSEVKVIKVFVAIKAKNGITVRTQLRHRRTLFDTRGEPFFDWEWRYSAGNVTHWMPLPTPPKEDV